MQAIADHLFALPSVHALLQQELVTLSPELAGVFGRHGLFVRTHAAAPDDIAAPMLARWVRLHVENDGQLGGDLNCSVDALPFEDDSFRVVVVQHAGERLADARGFGVELARVLEPGGVAILTGFHPFSLWRPWLSWQQRGLLDAAQLCTAERWRSTLAQCGVRTYAVRRIGRLPISSRPSSISNSNVGARLLLAPLRPSYVLLARKRPLGMTPQFVRNLSPTRTARPQLVSGSQRARA